MFHCYVEAKINRPVLNSLRHRLQVERAEERCILDLLDRRWRSARGCWRVTAGSFTTGAPLAPALRASSGQRPGGCGSGRSLALVWATPTTWIWRILYGTVKKKRNVINVVLQKVSIRTVLFK